MYQGANQSPQCPDVLLSTLMYIFEIVYLMLTLLWPQPSPKCFTGPCILSTENISLVFCSSGCYFTIRCCIQLFVTGFFLLVFTSQSVLSNIRGQVVTEFCFFRSFTFPSVTTRLILHKNGQQIVSLFCCTFHYKLWRAVIYKTVFMNHNCDWIIFPCMLIIFLFVLSMWLAPSCFWRGTILVETKIPGGAEVNVPIPKATPLAPHWFRIKKCCKMSPPFVVSFVCEGQGLLTGQCSWTTSMIRYFLACWYFHLFVQQV